jgi:hypothetical protein
VIPERTGEARLQASELAHALKLIAHPRENRVYRYDEAILKHLVVERGTVRLLAEKSGEGQRFDVLSDLADLSIKVVRPLTEDDLLILKRSRSGPLFNRAAMFLDLALEPDAAEDAIGNLAELYARRSAVNPGHAKRWLIAVSFPNRTRTAQAPVTSAAQAGFCSFV